MGIGGIIQLLTASALATAIPSSVPERFKGEAIVITQFVADVSAHCPIKVPHGYVLLACHQRLKSGDSLLTLPLPCDRGESYADIVCHEIGHARGWPGTHGA